jgi:multimeric flavodoxin WrbA/putative sterol carrier protein
MKQLSKPRQLLLYAGPFPALAFFKIWASSTPGPGSLAVAALFMLAFCVIMISVAYRWDKPSYFDWTVSAYFALISLSLIAWPEPANRLLSQYSVTGIYVCLFAAAFFPPLLGMDPFTYHYAKKYTPEAAWNNPIFVRINRIMTYTWSGIFALSVVLSLYPSVITRAFIPLGIILGFGLPFNLRFPDFYLRKLGLPTLKQQKEMALEETPSKGPAGVSEHLPGSAWEAVSRMPDVFSPEAAGDLKAVIGFVVSGSETFEAYLNIRDGACILEKRFSGEPDLVIRTPSEVWLAIARKEMSGQEAFLRRAYTAEGNLGLLIKMKDLFAGEARSSGAENPAPEKEQPAVAAKAGETGSVPQNPGHARKENTMKVLALNSSPRGEGQSKTELMLNPLVQGMRDAGAEVEVVDLRKKTIRNCSGCFTCWTKTPGVCIHKDDMSRELFPKFIESDLVVYATPLYHFTVNATMKAFIERTLPILQPFLEGNDEATKHPLRHEFPKAVFLSVAGFPEMSVFDQLSSWVRFVFGRSELLAAEIYRPAAESMAVSFYKDKTTQVLEAARQAGREIVQSMKISEETLARVTQDFVGDKESFRKMGNLFWKSCIQEGMTPKEFGEKGLMPRPDSVETFMMVLPLGFNPAGAGDTKAVLQFDFSGSVEGSCHFRIENGTISAIHGPAQSPDLTVDSPFDVWMDIMTGKADGQQMFMAQKYKVKGDLSLLMRMNQIFGKQK